MLTRSWNRQPSGEVIPSILNLQAILYNLHNGLGKTPYTFTLLLRQNFALTYIIKINPFLR